MADKIDKTAHVSILRTSERGGSSDSAESTKSASSLEANRWTKGATTFDNDSDLQNFYKPIERYEGYHRYDPDYTWSEEDEKKIVRKVRALNATDPGIGLTDGCLD